MQEAKLILTLAQAHELQADIKTAGMSDTPSYWGQWTVVLNAPVPNTADNLMDPERLAAGLAMMRLGSSDEQVAEQLKWKPRGAAVRGCRTIFKREVANN